MLKGAGAARCLALVIKFTHDLHSVLACSLQLVVLLILTFIDVFSPVLLYIPSSSVYFPEDPELRTKVVVLLHECSLREYVMSKTNQCMIELRSLP